MRIHIKIQYPKFHFVMEWEFWKWNYEIEFWKWNGILEMKFQYGINFNMNWNFGNGVEFRK